MQVIATAHETLDIMALEKLFLTDQKSGKLQEPVCQNYVDFQSESYSDEVWYFYFFMCFAFFILLIFMKQRCFFVELETIYILTYFYFF